MIAFRTRWDGEAAAIDATAGRPGWLTVDTNTGERIENIRLGVKVTRLCGLHVISLVFNDVCRLDRQLTGRAAWQGSPGSSQ